MKRIWFIVCIIACCSACQSKTQKEGLEAEFSKKKFMIPDSLFSFFDEYEIQGAQTLGYSYNAEVTGTLYAPQRFLTIYILRAYSFTDTLYFSEIKSLLIKNKIQPLPSEKEQQYFIISSEQDMLNMYDSLDLKHMTNLNVPLLPNFHSMLEGNDDLLDKTTLSGLPHDSEIYILESGNKYVLCKKHKYDWLLLPEKIRHGYTGGIAVSKSKLAVIYWIVVW